MAKNECYSSGGGCNITLNEADAAYFGAALDSGEAAEWSEFTGVALIDFTADTDGVMTRCIGFELTVTPQDDGGAQAVAVGDPLYYHDTTGVIDKAVNGGQFLGWAMTAITTQEGATDICILLDQDPDYTRFMDEQLLEFGDGAAGKGGAGDFKMWFELDDQDMYMENVLAGSRWYMDTTDTGVIRMQDHLYTHVTGEQTAVKIGGRLSVDGTGAIQSLNVVPSIDDGIGCAHMIGINTDVYMRGTTGDITGVVRAGQFQISDAGANTRTVTGPMMLLRTWAQTHCTATNGLYTIYSEAQGGTTAFTAWLYCEDDGGQQADLASAVSATVIAVVTCEVEGAAVGYIPVYDGYTPA